MEMKITGMGLVCSLGGDVTDVFKRMCAGECGFRPITRFEAEPYAQKQAGQLSEDLENELRTAFPDEDISAAMMKRAGKEAMAQAKTAVAPERQGILLATNFGPMESLEWAWRERLDTQAMDEASYEPYDAVIAQMAEAFNCKGPRLQISMSCASGAAAASLAADVIREGRADRMLVLQSAHDHDGRDAPLRSGSFRHDFQRRRRRDGFGTAGRRRHGPRMGFRSGDEQQRVPHDGSPKRSRRFKARHGGRLGQFWPVNGGFDACLRPCDQYSRQ